MNKKTKMTTKYMDKTRFIKLKSVGHCILIRQYMNKRTAQLSYFPKGILNKSDLYIGNTRKEDYQ